VQVTEEQDAVPARPGARRRGPGESEAEVLAVLHRVPGPFTAGWVHEQIAAALAYTTVVTILTRLEAKHAVCASGVAARSGGRRRWTKRALPPGGCTACWPARATAHAVLARFVADLSPDDEQALRRRLRTGPHPCPEPGSASDD